MTATIRHVSPWHFLVVLLPLLVYQMNSEITGTIGVTEFGIGAAALDPARSHMEAAGRMPFLGAVWFFGIVVLSAVFAFTADLVRPLTLSTRAAACMAVAIPVLLVAQDVVRHQTDPEASRSYHRLGRELFDSALAQSGMPGCPTPDDRWLFWGCTERPVVMLLNNMLDIVNVLSAVGIAALVAGMVLALAYPPARAGASADDRAFYLARSQRDVRKYVYLSGIVLTSGMFVALTWMRWPVLMLGEGARGDYMEMVDSYAVFSGIYFSLLILSFYVPVALILEARIRRLAEENVEATGGRRRILEIDEWKKTHGLGPTRFEGIREGLAIAAPVITAFAGSFSPLAS